MDKVEIVYRHPNPRVMASGPRILDYTPPGKEMEFFDPEEREIKIEDGKSVTAIVYTLPPMYARRLLSAQPERYFLLSPDKLIVPILTQSGMRRENTMVKSILTTWKTPEKPKVEVKPEPEKEPEKDEGTPPPGHPQGHPLRPQINPDGQTPDPEPIPTEPVPDVDPPEEQPKTGFSSALPNPLARPSVGDE